MSKLFFKHFNYKIYTEKYTKQMCSNCFGSTSASKSFSRDQRMLLPASENNFTKPGNEEEQETFYIGEKQGLGEIFRCLIPRTGEIV